MATMRTRRLGWTIAAGAALLSLRPIGPFERLADLALAPARVLGFMGAPSLLGGPGGSPADAGGAPANLERERELSGQLELAILRSAEPEDVPWPIRGVVPIPGEVDVSEDVNRDRVSLRVADPGPVERGQAVIAGDVFVGTVEKIPVREPYRDRPGLLERFLRRAGLSSPPIPPPRDLVIVRLITDPSARVGARVESTEDGAACRMVVGGLERLEDRVWLAVHNPESENTLSGRVVVHESAAVVDSADSVASGFLLGDLGQTTVAATERTPRRHVVGVDPLLNFEAGLNQVLVLTPGRGPGVVDPRRSDIVGVLEATGWRHVDMASLGDLCPWRSTGRLDVGRNVGVRVMALAQPADDPGATPLVLGELVSAGRSGAGEVVLRWQPASGSRHDEWIHQHSGGGASAEVHLWTGSGMRRVPRGLLLGRASLRSPEEPGGALFMELTGTGDPGAELKVRTGSSRLARPAGSNVVFAAEGER